MKQLAVMLLSEPGRYKVTGGSFI